MKTLSDICEVYSGYALKEFNDQNDGLPVIKIGNIMTDGTLALEECQYTSEVVNEKYYSKKGDIYVALSGATTGKIGILESDERHVINQRVGVVRRKDNDVPQQFVKYFLMRQTDRILQEASGCAQPNISPKQIAQYEVPKLSKTEMEEISIILDKLSYVITQRKDELEKLDELIKARFVEAFGERGKVVPLTDYVWFQEGPGVRSVDFTDNGTILLTGSNINNNEISFGYKSDRFISKDLASGKYAHFICDKDDILVVSSAIAPEKFDKKVTIVKEDKKYCLNTGIIRFKPKLEVMTLGYFREFLKTDYFKHQVMAEMRGIAQMHFGPSHLKQMTILLPESIEQQIEFEKFVKQVDKSKVAVQKVLDETQTLFDSLMQEYFG